MDDIDWNYQVNSQPMDELDNSNWKIAIEPHDRKRVLESTKNKRVTLKLKVKSWISEDFYSIQNLKL